MKERYCSGKERNTQAAPGTLVMTKGFQETLRSVQMYRNVLECIGLTFHTPQNVLECIGMYWLYFSYSPECIGMYRTVLALLFILPRMYWNVSECIGFTFHTPQDDPIHSDTFQYIHFQSI